MPGLASPTRAATDLGAQQRSNQIPQPGLETGKKRRSFLAKFKDNFHVGNGHSPPKSQSQSPNGYFDDPGSRSIKRASTTPDGRPTSSHMSSPRKTDVVFRPLSKNGANGSISPPQPAAAEAPPLQPAADEPPKSAMKQRPLSSTSKLEESDTLERVTTNASVETTDDFTKMENKTKIRFAEVAQNDSQRGAPRMRRQSSGASNSTARRSSIYFRSTEGGDYVEGVDAGVGSKARRLSVKLPQDMDVDECGLDAHFSYLARHNSKVIGEGGAAMVKLMTPRNKADNVKVYAVKAFRPWEPEEEEEFEYVAKIKSEYAIAKACDAPNVVKTYYLCTSGKEWMHVMEYCELGDLNDLVKTNTMSLEDRNCMFKQLLRGLTFLHDHGVAHRDIKSENLVVTKDGALKIADFGTSEVFAGPPPGNPSRHCRRPSLVPENVEIRLCEPGLVGSRPYMAPELLAREKAYDPRGIDVWSAAIVFITLHERGTPWTAALKSEKNFGIFHNSYCDWMEKHNDAPMGKSTEDLPRCAAKMFPGAHATPGAIQMVFGLLDPRPEKRWTVKQALEVASDRESKWGPWPCCQQDGYSDDIKTREKKVRHNHVPPAKAKKGLLGK
ncbi:hypothetical protein LTR95_002157 [Oleoguttula sp. CCFEE 5521]